METLLYEVNLHKVRESDNILDRFKTIELLSKTWNIKPITAKAVISNIEQSIPLLHTLDIKEAFNLYIDLQDTGAVPQLLEYSKEKIPHICALENTSGTGLRVNYNVKQTLQHDISDTFK